MMSCSAAPSSDVTMPMRRGRAGSGRLRASSNRPSAASRLPQLLVGELQRAQAPRLHVLADQLVLAARIVDAEPAAGHDVDAVFGLEAQQPQRRSEHHALHLRVGVLQREIEMAGVPHPGPRQLALDPDLGEARLDEIAQRRSEFAHRDHAPGRPRRRFVERQAAPGSHGRVDRAAAAGAIAESSSAVIRIGDHRQAYRIAKLQGDLCTIEPKLKAAADPETTEIKVEKVTRFDAFTLRDVQAHQVYVGHSELLNLEQRAQITLVIEPASVMRRLVELGISAALWGTPDRGQPVGEEIIPATGGEDPKPDWRPLDFDSVSPDGITFIKPWTGKVEKFEVRGEKSLWLRLALGEKIPNRDKTGTRVNTLKIKIESLKDPNAPDPEGSETVERAFHNSTPLSVGTRFLPFGPEPQRFDTFSLAAPEAFSKKGAKVTLHVELVDATIKSLTLVAATAGPPRGYAIGRNGGLQAMAFDENPVRWQRIDPPKKLPTGAASDTELRLELEETTAGDPDRCWRSKPTRPRRRLR